MKDKDFWHLRYWSDRFQETTKEAAPFRRSFYNIPITPLTVEETIKLREILTKYSSFATLLAQDLDEIDRKRQKKSIWKKLFRK